MGLRGRFARALGWLWVAATVAVSGCGGSGKGASGGTSGQGGAGGIDGGVDGPGAAVFTHPLCGTPYPAQACDGDPHGQWTLAALCVNRYQDCPGAVVKPSGTATATIDFQDGSPEAYFEYSFNYDIETRYSVPPSCIAGGNCEAIGCFAGDNPCSCIVGNGYGGGVRARWTPNITGEVVATTRERDVAILRRRHDRGLVDGGDAGDLESGLRREHGLPAEQSVPPRPRALHGRSGRLRGHRLAAAGRHSLRDRSRLRRHRGLRRVRRRRFVSAREPAVQDRGHLVQHRRAGLHGDRQPRGRDRLRGQARVPGRRLQVRRR